MYDYVQINRQIVAARTGLNISEDRATIRGKEGMDCCSAVLLRLSRLEGRSSDTVSQNADFYLYMVVSADGAM